MRLQARQTLWGEVLSVNHSSKSCRIVIELKGTPESTAVIMKEATVEMGILNGAKVCAEVDASNVVLGVCQEGACTVTG
jgi:molybdopterin-binding protein